MSKKNLKNDNVQRFLDAIKLDPPGDREAWPLNPKQVLSYFDVDQALDIYEIVNKLLARGTKPQEIGKLFKRPTMLRYFLYENGILGLKFSSQLNIKKIPISERVKYIDVLTEILETMVNSDPFCSDYKNFILTNREIEKMKSDVYWFDINQTNRKIFLELGVDLFAYSWSFFYNLFVAAGYEIHGPYEYTENSKKYKLVIRENFDMNPRDLWGFDTGMLPIKLILLYREDVDFRLSFTNQPISEEHNEKLEKVAVCFGNKYITNLEIIKDLANKTASLTSLMTKKVNSLTPLDQVRKGAEISFYMLKDIYDFINEDWKPDRFVEPLIKKVGTEFIQTKKDEGEISASQWVKIFDPRDDYLGDLI